MRLGTFWDSWGMTLGNRWPDELTLRIFGKDRPGSRYSVVAQNYKVKA